MHVGRKGALLMMVVAVLWTAMPALACFVAPAQHTCCHGMAQECTSSVMNGGQLCCQVQQPDTVVPSLAASAPEHLIAAAPIVVHMLVPAATDVSWVHGTAVSPPVHASVGTSILRI